HLTHGARTYALAEGYAWIRERTPPTAIVQPNPNQAEFPFGLFAERSAVVAMPDCRGFTFHEEDCESAAAALRPYFSESPPGGLPAACGVYAIDLLVAEDSDPVWHCGESWVWKEAPVYANQFMRVFQCGR